MLSYIKQKSETINFGFAIVSGLFLFGIAVLTSIDVLMGFIFKKPITGAIEMIVLTIPWVVSLGLAFGLIKGAHVRVTIFYVQFPKDYRFGLDLFAHAIGFCFFSLMTYGAWLHFWSSWVIREPMFAALMTLPWWLGKLSLPIGMFLMAIQHLLELLTTLRGD
ncbi:MAG: TRAP transporter small permease subunit [Pseudomonadota bacterium]